MMSLVLAWAVLAPSVTPAHGFATAHDGAALHYLEAGKGPAILLVPGWTIPAEIFSPQLDGLSGRFRVISMDPRGHGRSSKTAEGHDMATRGRDIRAVIEQLQLAPVVLVGWSNGATEVASYIDQFGTERLAGVVLVDGTVGGIYSPAFGEFMRKMMGRLLSDRRGFTDAFVRSMYRKPQSDAYMTAMIEGVLQTPTTVAVTEGLAASLVDFRPALAKIDKPAMMVVAQNPPAVMNWYEDMRSRIPNVRYEVMEGVGHALFVDDSARFNALLEEFAKTTRAAQPRGR